jgi:hypothetical protein
VSRRAIEENLMKRLLLAVAVMASSANASRHPPVAIEKVRVTVTPLLCAGLCPGFDLAVSSDGRLRRHVMSSRRAIRRSQISARQYAAFRQALGLIRPASVGLLPCPKTAARQYELEWSGRASAGHMRVCSNDSRAVEATMRALLALHVDSNGFLPDEPDSPHMMSYR